MILIGEFAGLLTSIFFAINAVVVTKAGQKVGSSLIINRTRVVFALFYLVILNFILYRQPLPLQAGNSTLDVAFAFRHHRIGVGDAFLFQAYLMVGARLGTLLLSLSTIFGALEAWIFFDESLSLIEIIGIALTLGGIIWVILEHGSNKSQALRPSALGILCGVLAAIGQATGLVFSKQVCWTISHRSVERDPHVGGGHRIVADHIHATRSGKTIRILKENPSALQLLALGR